MILLLLVKGSSSKPIGLGCFVCWLDPVDSIDRPWGPNRVDTQGNRAPCVCVCAVGARACVFVLGSKEEERSTCSARRQRAWMEMAYT
jgi:hypothetical protein